MEYKHTLEVLYTQAEEIRNMARKLQQEEEIRRIDLDLLLEKLRNIYDLASDLRAVASDKIEIPESAEASIPEDIPEESDTPEPEFEVQQPSGEEEVAEKENPVKNKSIQDAKKGEAEKTGSGLVGDRFTPTGPSLNEEMSVKAKKDDISSQYKSSPISSITTAIGINERFELINELFDGNKERFDKTIEALNSADTFVQAYNYLEENFNWDMDNIHVQRILELIRRKLIVRRNEQ